jgi:hypothetical protein
LNNILSSKTNSAIFLAVLPVLGTIATILPSAQAQPYYEDGYESEYTKYMQDYKSKYPLYPDNSDYNSKDSSSSVVNKIKCNNINSNNNGVDVSLGVPNNDDAIAETQAADNEGQATSANEWRYGNEYKQKANGFKFVCVNNNDNENNIVVVNETTPIPPPPPPPTPPDTITCEECFTDNENLTPGQLEAINTLLGQLPTLTVPFFETQISVNDLAALCTYLTLSSTEENLRNSVFELIVQVNAFFLPLGENPIEESVAEEIVQCIIEALNNEV